MGDYNAYQNARKVFPVSVSSYEYDEDNPHVIENYIFDATVSDIIEAYRNGNVVEISVGGSIDEYHHRESKWILDTIRQQIERDTYLHFKGINDFAVEISNSHIYSLLTIARSALYGETSSGPKLVEITLTETDVQDNYTASKTAMEVGEIIDDGDIPYFKFHYTNVFINGTTASLIVPGREEGVVSVLIFSYTTPIGNTVQTQLFEIDTNTSSDPV